MQLMTFTELHVKWSVTLVDRWGPEILTVLEVKGQVLHDFSRFQFDSSILDILGDEIESEKKCENNAKYGLICYICKFIL